MITRALPALLFTFLFLVFASVSVLNAQEGDEYDFSDIPVEEDELPYIGVGAGYILHVAFPDLAELQSLAARFGFPDGDESPLSSPVWIHGGGGWTAIGVIPNVRLGVYGAGGTEQTDPTDMTTSDGTTVKRTVRLSSGFTAAHLDYAIPVFSGFTVAPGLMIGGGTNTLSVLQTNLGSNFDQMFDTAAFGGTSANNNRQMVLTNNYLFLFPVLNLEYALTQFIMIRVGAGYALRAGKTWTDNQGTEIVAGPSTDIEKINTDGIRIQAGVFLGLFQQ